VSPDMLTGRTRLLSLYLHAQGHYTTTHVGYEQMTLILKHANKNRLGAIDWGPNDFDVCVSDRCIGRIFLSRQAPVGRPWFWTITAMDYPPTIHSRGYSPTREHAMAGF
jgi:hypothetical protein